MQLDSCGWTNVCSKNKHIKIIRSIRNSRTLTVWVSLLWCRSLAIARITRFLRISCFSFWLFILKPALIRNYLSLAFVLLHLHWHFGCFLYLFLLLWSACLVLFHELGKYTVKHWLILFNFDVMLSGQFVAFGFGFEVCFRVKYRQRVVHFVEPDSLLNQFECLLSIFIFCEFLNLCIFGIEWWDFFSWWLLRVDSFKYRWSYLCSDIAETSVFL